MRDAVVVELLESKGHALDPLDEVVHRLGWTIGELAVMPGGDLGAPAREGAAKASDLGWSDPDGEVGRQLIEPMHGELLVLVAVEITDCLLGFAQGVATWSLGPPASSSEGSLVLLSSLSRFSASVSRRRQR